MEFLIVTVLLIGFALAALYWGSDSCERLDSSEWSRREQVQMFL